MEEMSLLSLCSEFNTAVDIRLHKWADSLSLGKLCAEVSPHCLFILLTYDIQPDLVTNSCPYYQVGTDTMFGELHNKLEVSAEGGNRFHSLSQGLREEVERLTRKEHQWESYNVDQLVSQNSNNLTPPRKFLLHT